MLTRKENGGWVVVNNQGVEISSGEYILFAQCDDICEPGMVEELVVSMRSHPTAGIAFCRSLLVDEEGAALGNDYDAREASFKEMCTKDVLIDKHQMAKFLFHSCVIPNISALLIQRECFDRIGVFPSDYKVCGDWEWFFRVAEHYDVAYVASPLNSFMQHDSTIRSSTKDREVYAEYFDLLLSNQKKFNLSFAEQCRARMRVMELWSIHLLSPSMHGLFNFTYHLSLIARLDVVAILFLPPAIIFRMLSIFRKVIGKLFD